MPDIEIVGFMAEKAEEVEGEIRDLVESQGSEALKADVVYTTHLGGVRVTAHKKVLSGKARRPYIRLWGVLGEPQWDEAINLIKENLPYDIEPAALDGFYEGTYEESPLSPGG